MTWVNRIAKLAVLIVFLVSILCLIIVFQSGYVGDALMARALPLSIVVGLTAIATCRSD